MSLGINNKKIILIILSISCLLYYFTSNSSIVLFISILSIIPAMCELKRKPIFSIQIVLFFAFSAMGLLPTIELFGGTLNWADNNIIVFFVLTVFCMVKRIRIYIDKIGVIIIVYMLFRVVGAATGLSIYHQQFFVGLLVRRETYIYLCYFPISAIIKKYNYTKEQVFQEIIAFVKVITIVYLVQVVLLYLNLPVTNYRYEIRWGYRLRASNSLQIVGFFASLYYLLQRRLDKKIIMWTTLFLVEIVFVSQSRLLILGTVISSLIMIVLHPRVKKKLLIICMCFFSAVVLLIIPQVRNVISDSIAETENDSSGTYAYRVYEKQYFENMLKGHEWIGIGTPNMHIGEAARYSGMTQKAVINGFYIPGFYLSDLGTFEIRYYWGYIGIVLYYFMFFSFIIIAYIRLYVKRRYVISNFVVFGMLLLGLIVSNTIEFFIGTSGLFFAILLLFKRESDHFV